jgi:putative FmdB family regulatory protein
VLAVPLYEYHCGHCGTFEVIRKFSDPALTACPTCGAEIEKLLSAPAIQFKGSGWYITDYARKGGNGGGKSEKADKAAEKSEKGEKSGSEKSSSEKSSSDSSSTSSTKEASSSTSSASGTTGGSTPGA